eukprot:GHVU01207911.1.p3 GENE.GHVU01207911.1~~GHVU01207911.1.p3  ORF type:complete len:161 (+),score=11.48 GHVU01207911.1:604-1086(+)
MAESRTRHPHMHGLSPALPASPPDSWRPLMVAVAVAAQTHVSPSLSPSLPPSPPPSCAPSHFIFLVPTLPHFLSPHPLRPLPAVASLRPDVFRPPTSASASASAAAASVTAPGERRTAAASRAAGRRVTAVVVRRSLEWADDSPHRGAGQGVGPGAGAAG